MKTKKHDKFEGGIYSSKGYEGGSYKVNVTCNTILTNKEEQIIKQIVDKFDHTLTTDIFSLSDAVGYSLRIITINEEMNESMYAQILFNLIKSEISSLEEVEVFNSFDKSYICNEESKIEISFKCLIGK